MAALPRPVCTRCLNDDTIPGLTFDGQGLCSPCQEYDRWLPRLADGQTGRRWADRVTHGRASAGRHEVLAGFSGGKDSTYVLHHLVRTDGLRVKAVTVLNGFLTDWARRNIEATVADLGVDHVFVELPQRQLAPLYLTALAGTGGICTACAYLTFSTLLTLAAREGIPVVVHGRSPAQMLRFLMAGSRDPDLPFMQAALEAPEAVDLRATYRAAIARMRQSLPPAHWERFAALLPDPESDRLADFLPYFLHHRYDELEIIAYLEAHTPWRRHPEAALLRHYDCRACEASNYLGQVRHGRPHILAEVSAAIRLGQLTRAAGQARLAAERFAAPPDASLEALTTFVGRSRAETLALARGQVPGPAR